MVGLRTEGHGSAAAPGADEGRITGTGLDVAVVIELDVGPVDDGFCLVRFQIDGSTAGSAQGKGWIFRQDSRCRRRLGGCLLRLGRCAAALGRTAVEEPDEILGQAGSEADAFIDRSRNDRRNDVNLIADRVQDVAFFLGLSAAVAVGNAAGEGNAVDEACRFGVCRKSRGFDEAGRAVEVILRVQVFNGCAVGDVDVVNSDGHTGSGRACTGIEGQNGIIDVCIVIATE